MNARSVNAAAGVVQAAWAQGRRTAAGVAMALDAAQLLMSPETAAELARLREERHSTNESVDEAARALREKRDQIAELQAANDALRARLTVLEGQRAALAERLRVGQSWESGRLLGEDLVGPTELRQIFGIPLAPPLAEAAGLTRLTPPVQALRASWEDRHDGERSHSYRLGHDLDLPPLGGA